MEILLDELEAMKEKFDDKKPEIEQIEDLVKGLKKSWPMNMKKPMVAGYRA